MVLIHTADNVGKVLRYDDMTAKRSFQPVDGEHPLLPCHERLITAKPVQTPDKQNTSGTRLQRAPPYINFREVTPSASLALPNGNSKEIQRELYEM
ncbi:hypothetical protein BofuT4_P015650.1 [Botrytis cinerea T4]|uniref:Uncharacterized protein n=1 Tax=Botryotinia fuckeliana (strain T4) TaxID=999810 RepID=G2YHS2_BOTF4|nr:hypothetical protein BofuT4_P015650.1 [Botrytis cinerea T4]